MGTDGCVKFRRASEPAPAPEEVDYSHGPGPYVDKMTEDVDRTFCVCHDGYRQGLGLRLARYLRGEVAPERFFAIFDGMSEHADVTCTYSVMRRDDGSPMVEVTDRVWEGDVVNGCVDGRAVTTVVSYGVTYLYVTKTLDLDAFETWCNAPETTIRRFSV